MNKEGTVNRFEETWPSTRTKRDRLAVAKQLRLARPAIHHGSEKYICLAVLSIKPFCSRQMRMAAHFVHERLDGYATVEAYLQHEVGVPRKQLTATNCRVFRERWIDSMVAELEAK